jgi:hypothetical protein
MTRNIDTGHVDVFMYWMISKNHNEVQTKPGDRVDSLQWISVVPKDAGNIYDKLRSDAAKDQFGDWVPQATISLLMCLGYVVPASYETFLKSRKLVTDRKNPYEFA